MAEAAGIAIGAVGLLTLYGSCIEAIDQYRTVRRFSSDYEQASTKLLCLQSRLKQCQNKCQVLDPTTAPVTDNDYWLQHRVLAEIQRLLESAKQYDKRYRPTATTGDNGSSNAVKEPETSAIVSSSQSRQGTQEPVSLPFHRKVKWAAFDKKELDHLVTGLTFFIDHLERHTISSPTHILAQRVSAEAEVDAAIHEPSIGDPAKSCQRHLYSRNDIGDQARVVQGDAGNLAARGNGSGGHWFMDNKIAGTAQVLQGDSWNIDMSSFWTR